MNEIEAELEKRREARDHGADAYRTERRAAEALGTQLLRDFVDQLRRVGAAPNTDIHTETWMEEEQFHDVRRGAPWDTNTSPEPHWVRGEPQRAVVAAGWRVEGLGTVSDTGQLWETETSTQDIAPGQPYPWNRKGPGARRRVVTIAPVERPWAYQDTVPVHVALGDYSHERTVSILANYLEARTRATGSDASQPHV